MGQFLTDRWHAFGSAGAGKWSATGSTNIWLRWSREMERHWVYKHLAPPEPTPELRREQAPATLTGWPEAGGLRRPGRQVGRQAQFECLHVYGFGPLWPGGQNFFE